VKDSAAVLQHKDSCAALWWKTAGVCASCNSGQASGVAVSSGVRAKTILDEISSIASNSSRSESRLVYM